MSHCPPSLTPLTPPPVPQIIEKRRGHIRSRVFREVEMLYQCQGHRYGGAPRGPPTPGTSHMAPRPPIGLGCGVFGCLGLICPVGLSHLGVSAAAGGVERGGGRRTLMAPNPPEALRGRRGGLWLI